MKEIFWSLILVLAVGAVLARLPDSIWPRVTPAFAPRPADTDIAGLEKTRITRPSYYVECPLAYGYLAAGQYDKAIGLLRNLEYLPYRWKYLKPLSFPNDYTTLDLYLGIAYSETGQTARAKHFLARAKKWILSGRCKEKKGPCYSEVKMKIVEAYDKRASAGQDPALLAQALAVFVPYAGVQ